MASLGLSKEEENYIRFTLLLLKVSPRAVRTCFDRELSQLYLPSTLITNYSTLYKLKLNRVLNQDQWNLLFPGKREPDSKTFDVTLMICLIRHLTFISPPINGYDCLPLPGETTPGSDLARIKWYRNKLAHYHSSTMDTASFNTAWSNLSDAVNRLGGPSMKLKCQELKEKNLDQMNLEPMLELKHVQEELLELRQAIEILGRETEALSSFQSFHRTVQTEHSKVTENLRNLQDFHSTLKKDNSKVTELLNDPIPWNIREQREVEMKRWKEDDGMFIETNGAKQIYNLIKERSCVVVCGSSGIGKSSIIRHVALKMNKESYTIIPVSNPAEIIKCFNPSKKILFVVDDFCGTYVASPIQLEKWKNLMPKIETLLERKPVKLITSCKLQVFRDVKMKILTFFQSCECNLLSEELCLSKQEKQSIAERYLQTKAHTINEYYYKFDCFPLLCKLFSNNTKLSIAAFCKEPFTVYKEEIDRLKTERTPAKYCALALCVMFNNHLEEKWFTEDVENDIKIIIENTYAACKVDKGTSRLVLRDELDSLTHTFIQKEGEVYRTIHDKLFDILAFYFGSVMIHCLIKNASSCFISERCLFDKKSNSDSLMIILPKEYQQIYIMRIVDDWSRGNVVNVFSNINMDNKTFSQHFLVTMKSLEVFKQKQLASLYDKGNESTPLIQCCYIGDIELVRWCLHHCISNVNHCRIGDGVSPLISACQEGHTEIVQMLISNMADMNKIADTGEPPLFIACQKGHIGIVQLLINNKADINQSTDTGESPLFIACMKGHIEIVKMLINNKADINHSADTALSHLPIGLQQEVHTEIGRMLFNHQAGIDKRKNPGSSEQFVAYKKGDTEISEND